jgi:hypothetical protein
MEGGREGSVYKITVIKSEENIPLWAPRHKWEDNIRKGFLRNSQVK